MLLTKIDHLVIKVACLFCSWQKDTARPCLDLSITNLYSSQTTIPCSSLSHLMFLISFPLIAEVQVLTRDGTQVTICICSDGFKLHNEATL